jgi:hypothetical protein
LDFARGWLMEGFKSHRQNNFLTTLGASGFDDVAN